jgi:hypothetical protein
MFVLLGEYFKTQEKSTLALITLELPKTETQSQQIFLNKIEHKQI